jgi:hypothetical protein
MLALEYELRVRRADDPIRQEADCLAEGADAASSYVIRVNF